MSYVLTVAGISILIILHELGHFAAAKAVGMRVERFSLFFPPLLLRRKRGETEYAIGSIPLGGYVKITGMNPTEEIPPEVEPRAYYRQAVWKRVVVIAAGPFMSILTAFVILWGLYAFRGEPSLANQVGAIEKAQPAAGVLRSGDTIVSVDGRRGGADVISRQIASHRCAGTPRAGCRATTPVTFVIERGQRRLTIRLVPRYDPRVKRTRVGFSFDGLTYRSVGPGKAASLSVSSMWRITKGTVSAIARIFQPKERKQISGIVGITEVTSQAFKFDAAQALNVLAIISLSLGLLNLLPFLPLDGGHIFWALAEKVRGKPIPFWIVERASVVGFMLVVLLAVIGLTNDIDRLRGDGFGVR
jgi:regulator of sigma E protease